MPRPEIKHGHVHDRRPGGRGAGERHARRRRQVRRRRDPRLLLRAQARPAGRRLPHVPGRDRGHPEAADRVLDAGQGRHGRPHADRARARGAAARSSSSCSSTTRSTARSATRAASARCRTSPTAGAPGTSRFIEPKRHFRKPLELSPLIAIDRERCILCYRCVRFSQEISEDYQLVLQERGAHSFVGTFDGHPYVAPFSGNIIELCPVGALTSRAYRFRARPWDIEGAGIGVHAVPVAVQRRAARCATTACMRVLARDHDDVDDGWLCDKGRFAFQYDPLRRAHHAAAGARGRRAACRRRGSKALDAAAAARSRRRGARGRAAGGETHQRGGASCSSGCSARRSLRRPRLARRAARCRATCARARRPAPAGDGPRPRVRPRRAGARLRAGRRRADPRPAHPQGRAPPRRAARGRLRAADRAGPQRRAVAALRAGRRRGAAGRARRRARRRRGQPRRRRPTAAGTNAADACASSPSCCAAPARTS